MAAPRLAQSTICLRHRAALVHRQPASLQLSIHYLPVGRVDCQLGCLDVWQKRHAQTPSAHDCIPARVLVRDVVVLEPLRPRRSHGPQRSLFQRAGLQSTPPAAQSARISAAESPAPPRFRTTQNYAPSQRHTFCPGKRGRAAAAPVPDSIRAAAAHKPRIRCRAQVQRMKGILRIEEPGWRSSAACRRCGIRKERIHRRPHN